MVDATFWRANRVLRWVLRTRLTDSVANEFDFIPAKARYEPLEMKPLIAKPVRNGARWIVRHPKSSIFAAIGLAFLVLNVLAYHHVWSMTHFLPAGMRTPQPESLSGLEKLKVSLFGVAIPKPSNTQDPRQFGLDFETDAFPGTDGVQLEAWYVPLDRRLRPDVWQP